LTNIFAGSGILSEVGSGVERFRTSLEIVSGDIVDVLSDLEDLSEGILQNSGEGAVVVRVGTEEQDVVDCSIILAVLVSVVGKIIHIFECHKHIHIIVINIIEVVDKLGKFLDLAGTEASSTYGVGRGVIEPNLDPLEEAPSAGGIVVSHHS
jgi:hypothetical protein